MRICCVDHEPESWGMVSSWSCSHLGKEERNRDETPNVVLIIFLSKHNVHERNYKNTNKYKEGNMKLFI